MKLENVNLERLKPLERNVRKHNEVQINELVKSIEQFGQTRAIVIDEDNNILIGNGLYIALKQMGRTEAQCYRLTGLNETQKKKLILSDNKIYSLGADDYQEIQNYINDITITGDFEIAGYDKFVLEQMTATNEEMEEAVASYGTVTDIRFTEERNEPEVQSSNVPVQNEPQQEAKPTTIVTETQVGAKPERKYVICPSCGEVIYLD